MNDPSLVRSYFLKIDISKVRLRDIFVVVLCLIKTRILYMAMIVENWPQQRRSMNVTV